MEDTYTVQNLGSMGDQFKQMGSLISKLLSPLLELAGVLRLNIFALNKLGKQIDDASKGKGGGRGGKEGFGTNLSADLAGFALLQFLKSRFDAIVVRLKQGGQYLQGTLPGLAAPVSNLWNKVANIFDSGKSKAFDFIKAKILDPYAAKHPIISSVASKAAEVVGSYGLIETVLTIISVLGSLIAVILELVFMFKIMEKASQAYVQAATANMGALVTAGGNQNQGGLLHSVAGGFGMSDADFGKRARSFGDLLTQGGIPAAIAAQQGIRPYGGLGGDQNYLNKFLKAIQDVTDPTRHSFREAGTMARYEGLEDFMWLRQADEAHRKMVFGAMGLNLGPQEQREAANAQAEMYAMQKQLNDAWLDFGRQALPIVITGLKAISEIAIFLVNNLATIFGALIGGTIGFFMGGPMGALAGLAIGGVAGGALGGLRSRELNGAGADEVMNNNTKAVQENTAAVYQNTMMQNGSYGGGSVFQSGNLIPKSWGFNQLQLAANGTSIALGALTL